MMIPAPRRLLLALAVVSSLMLPPARGVAEGPSQEFGDMELTASQVVDRLVEKNAERAGALERYSSRRSYRLDYKGFPIDLHAEMIVDMSYKAPGTKQFTVVSESGNEWIIRHIFR